MNSCPICAVPRDRFWLTSEHAIAFGADDPIADGHTIVALLQHANSIHALADVAQKDIWALLSQVRERLQVGLVPNDGFSIGFVDALTAAVPVQHALVHIVPRHAGDGVVLPGGAEWIVDDGILPPAN